jgi:hypothetical protein
MAMVVVVTILAVVGSMPALAGATAFPTFPTASLGTFALREEVANPGFNRVDWRD